MLDGRVYNSSFTSLSAKFIVYKSFYSLRILLLLILLAGLNMTP